MKKKDKIFLAGHKGLVGSAVFNELKKKNFDRVFISNKKKLNLLNENKVMEFFKNKKFDVVLICAAKVGGIYSNSHYSFDFLVENLSIQNNIFKACIKYNVREVMFLGSSCIYPKNANIPIKEDYILSGKLEKTNEAYALAKISGLRAAESMISKHNMDVRCFMPCNLYGNKDQFFDEKNSHVLPALMNRIYEAKLKNIPEVVIWGDGSPKREFMFSEDLAKNLVKCMRINKTKFYKNIGKNYFYNIGSNFEISIKSLSEKLAKIIGYEGKLKFDKSKPNGTLRKYMSKNKIKKIISLDLTNINTALQKTFQYYLDERKKNKILIK